MCRQERGLCGFAHNQCIIDSVRLTCIESRLKEKLDFERRADFGVGDGDGKTVTIMNRLVIWSNQLEVEVHSRNREILFVRMNLTGPTSAVSYALVASSGQIAKKFGWANELGVGEVRDRRDPRVHHVYTVICQMTVFFTPSPEHTRGQPEVGHSSTCHSSRTSLERK